MTDLRVNPLAVRTRRDVLRDALSELFGIYRAAAIFHGTMIAFGARVKSPSLLRIGKGSTIQRGALIHCGGKSWSNYSGSVSLGVGVAVGPNCVIFGAGGVVLQDHVHLGPGAMLMSQAGKHDKNRLTASPSYSFESIVIGAGSWIGAGAVVLGGSRLGRCVNVAPNAVVSGTIPDNAVVVGNPARILFVNEDLQV